MDSSERLVEDYLRSLGYSDIRYEPDGKVSPDFLVSGHIAVEVRRLNQNVATPSGGTEGIEQAFIPLWERIDRYLPTLGPSIDGESWWVNIRMRRPIDPWRQIKPLVQSALRDFMRASIRQVSTLEITPQLELDLTPASTAFDSFFVLASGIDSDAGGFIVAEVSRNLQLCITEKELKIAPVRLKYPEWWLVLPDHIGHGLDAESRRQLLGLPAISHSWNKVILLNPKEGLNNLRQVCYRAEG